MKEPFHALNIDKGKALGHFIRKMHAVHGINKAFVQEIVEIALPTVSVVAFIVIGIPVVIDALRSNADILAIALFAFEEFEDVCENIFISSEQGFEGYKGFITDLLKPAQYDAVFTCGPLVMMSKIIDMCKESNTPIWCSMEKHMGCGIGACLTCSCKTTNGMKRTCKDGPVFKGEELVF